MIFGGFSAEAYTPDDARCKVVVTTRQFRRGKPAPLKPAVDEALTRESPVEGARRPAHRDRGRLGRGSRRLVARPGRRDRHPRGAAATASTRCSSSTRAARPGSPGHLPHERRLPHQLAYTNAVIHDVHPETDVWGTADVGWVTGHSYIVYGPLANGAAGDVRGHPRHPAPGPLVGAHREVRRHGPLRRPRRSARS